GLLKTGQIRAKKEELKKKKSTKRVPLSDSKYQESSSSYGEGDSESESHEQERRSKEKRTEEQQQDQHPQVLQILRKLFLRNHHNKK
ncbi:hypothetical protein PIB30_099883, partial [Stylosanthes scabra]|nr:hypothetical protein [Stylosanthes scabra]